ncbi:hypothetical protein PGT21_027717 [Puccinia graminis f. sp. tritici]|uniref:Uncharacterized protein n=2 Tax=Puccinia graminis f. sp. tritici TaxID=56615 RepID=E3JSK9_PUCGT|nr:uncharacterized protein PGTG_01627 [Puccinia graminis f. sp. tritici CRL 75-36-700-3]EFP75034.1 hypothetical protein PGTG_01627 [Puccinia graminis f. sp. tritici CRL 75-36-700-3]KAA1112239.1 hypothetical protein PGTUg99_009205 [Puccinia graminis f. sp. tritici]KAA1117940.1 hypothetical protein PGT21_027717 [Puccinia graminis f. sp. tritici]
MPVLACQQPMMSLTIVRHAPRGAASRIYQAANRSFMTSTASRSAQQLAGYNGSTPLYHHQPSGQLSFLDTPPVFPGSPTVIGTLSAQGRFQGNPSFVDLLHSVFCGVYLDDPYVRDLALSRKSASADSYLHVLGTRTKSQHINDRDPASIIFSFLAQSTTGLPVPDTYEPNPALRIYTPLDGFLVFPASLQQALLKGCKVARMIEEDSTN